jgi:hypothetical protein
MTPSELLFSGYWTPKNVAALPPELVLPKTWTSRMKEMGKATARKNLETGSCLTWIASADDEARVALVRDYQALTSKRSMMAAEKYGELERALRAKIEDAGAAALGARGTWAAGKMQIGLATSIPIEVAGVPCDGETVAMVHSHPSESAAPSDNDFYHFLSKPRVKASFSMFDDEVCGLVKTSDSSMNQTDRAKSLVSVAFESWDLSLLRKGVDTDYEMTVRSLTPVAATVAHAMGLGFYCGKIGHPLKLVPPMELQMNDPIFIVLAKGAVVALSYAFPDQIEPADFPYTPEIDMVFSSYLRRANWINAYDAQTALEATTPGDFYWTLMTSMSETLKGDLTLGSQVSIPNAHYSKKPYYATYCSIFNGAPACNVVENAPGLESNVKKLLGAFYQDGGNKSWLVVRTRDGYRRRDDGNGLQSERPCKFERDECLVAAQ